ncbi:metal-dependent hydrolase [Candidatus Pacearchaeota archaeon]|nr:metal-dependent hydrolase [Candidatus Pacearchaeota archaeon]
MPQAVTHILFPILLISIFRDFYLRKNEKKKFPLHYVLIAGIGGVLPDIDIIISIFLNLFSLSNWNVHKTLTHSIFFPLVFIILFLILKPIKANAKICNLTRHNLKLSTVFLMLAIGTIIHISLDSIFGEQAFFLYPFSSKDYGINIVGFINNDIQGFIIPSLDGILLVIWLIYLELKHKISDFI